MTDPHQLPRRPAKKSGEKRTGDMPALPETEAAYQDFFEGQLPGMPVSNDPLGHPGPTPPMRERKPLD